MPQTKPEDHGEGLQPKSKASSKVKRSEAGESPRTSTKTPEPAKKSRQYLKERVNAASVPTHGKGRPPKNPAYRMSHADNRYHGRG